MIDYCFMSWLVDECVLFYENEYISLQWCIILESLNNFVYSKGCYGYGGIWGGCYVFFYYNFLVYY